MLTDASAPRTLDTETLFAGLRGARGLILAVSGGPDSTALLLLIDHWRTGRHVPVGVATVDHRLRAQSGAEAQAVAVLCAARGLPHHTLQATDAGPATRIPQSRIQERARDARFALLGACAASVGADTIVTAHHADDQAETILMRLLRGSGPAGLAGMSPSTRRGPVTLARPLLDLPKATLVEFCRSEGVPFATDPSNDDPTYRRAQLRRLAPLLAAEGLDRSALRRLGRRAARGKAALAWAFHTAFTMAVLQEGPAHAVLSAAALAAVPEEFALQLVQAQIEKLSTSRVRLEQMEPLIAALRHAIATKSAFAATLGDALVRLREGQVMIARAPPRRDVVSAAD